MAHRSLLEFRCDTCKDFVQVDVTDGHEMGEDWPHGWVLIKAQVIGIEEEDERVFCPAHSGAIVRALGYNSLATMRAALDAVEDAKAAEHQRQRARDLLAERGPVIMTDDGGILLISDDEDDDE